MLEPDRDQLEIFVDAIFRHASPQGFVAIRSFFEGQDKVARLSSAALSGGLRFLMDVAEDDARRAAQNPKPVCFAPPLATFTNKARAREQDLAEGLTISVECDENPHQARATLEELIGPATVVVKSGGSWINGGDAEDKLHLHWRLNKPAALGDLAKLKQARELAAAIVGADPTTAPINHPLRWPGSWHRKAEPRLCRIAAVDPDREIDLDAALDALMKAAPHQAKPDDEHTNKNDQEDWPTLVGNIITGKSYHRSLRSMASSLVGSGCYDGTTVKILRAIMEASTAEHDQQRWQARYDGIPRAVKTAREKYSRREQPEHFTLHWHGGQPLEPQAWLIEDILPETGTGLVSGQWGTYKTFVTIDLAGAVMTGGVFIDHAVHRRGGVLFIAAEGAGNIAPRLQAMLADKHPTTTRAPFAWIEHCPPLVDPNAAEMLIQIAKQADSRMRSEFDLPLALIVIDTVVATAGFAKAGDENDAAIAASVMNTLAALSRGAAALVLGVDHFGKTVETGTRGSSAKEAAADVVLALLGDKEVSGAVTNTRLAVRKNRAGASGQEIAFAPRPVEVSAEPRITSLVIDWQATGAISSTVANKKDGWSNKTLRLLQRILMDVLVDHGQKCQPFLDMAEVRAVDIEIARNNFYRSMAADGDAKQRQATRRQAFHRAVNDAQDRRLIGVREVDGKTLLWLVQTPAQGS
jgi:hypothetical protein